MPYLFGAPACYGVLFNNNFPVVVDIDAFDGRDVDFWASDGEPLVWLLGLQNRLDIGFIWHLHHGEFFHRVIVEHEIQDS